MTITVDVKHFDDVDLERCAWYFFYLLPFCWQFYDYINNCVKYIVSTTVGLGELEVEEIGGKVRVSQKKVQL